MNFQQILSFSRLKAVSAQYLISEVIALSNECIFGKGKADPVLLSFMNEFLSSEYIYNSDGSDAIFYIFSGVEEIFDYFDLRAFIYNISRNFGKFSESNFALMYCDLAVNALSKGDCLDLFDKLLILATEKHQIIAINVGFENLMKINRDNFGIECAVLEGRLNQKIDEIFRDSK